MLATCRTSYTTCFAVMHRSRTVRSSVISLHRRSRQLCSLSCALPYEIVRRVSSCLLTMDLQLASAGHVVTGPAHISSLASIPPKRDTGISRYICPVSTVLTYKVVAIRSHAAV
jgi:hypothetical protein